MFKTADEAAIAAIELINPTSIARNVEFAGRIFQRGGKFFFTKSTTLGRSDDSDAGHKLPNTVNVGAYHTHAGGFVETDEIFSAGQTKGDARQRIIISGNSLPANTKVHAYQFITGRYTGRTG